VAALCRTAAGDRVAQHTPAHSQNACMLLSKSRSSPAKQEARLAAWSLTTSRCCTATPLQELSLPIWLHTAARPQYARMS
jgi:hypothetical protein